jgi:large subunit ribosomal protein L29
MKAHELNELSVQELRQRLSDEQESLANLRFQLATSQLESPIKVRTVRRDIARLLTVLRKKEGTAAATPAPAPTKTSEVTTS